MSTIRKSIRHTGGSSSSNTTATTSTSTSHNHSSGHEQSTLLGTYSTYILIHYMHAIFNLLNINTFVDAVTPGGAEVEIPEDTGTIHTSTVGNLDIVTRSKG